MTSSRITVSGLIAARKTLNAKITLLLNCISSHPSEIIWIFEGNDVQYYGPIIRRTLGARPRAVFSAGGKDSVLELLKYVSSNSDLTNNKFACFVDRDFDQVHPTSSILYITPCYSVENFYVSRGCFEAILQGCFGFHSFESEKEIARLGAMYERWLTKFLSSTQEFNAWIAVQKNQPGYQLKLNKVGISKLFNISWSRGKISIKKNFTHSTLNTFFPLSKKVTRREVQAQNIQLFASGDLVNIIRGKYLAEFLFIVLSHLKRDATSPNPQIFKASRPVTFPLSLVNFLSDLNSYAEIPVCLNRFLSNYST